MKSGQRALSYSDVMLISSRRFIFVCAIVALAPTAVACDSNDPPPTPTFAFITATPGVPPPNPFYDDRTRFAGFENAEKELGWRILRPRESRHLFNPYNSWIRDGALIMSYRYFGELAEALTFSQTPHREMTGADVDPVTVGNFDVYFWPPLQGRQHDLHVRARFLTGETVGDNVVVGVVNGDIADVREFIESLVFEFDDPYR